MSDGRFVPENRKDGKPGTSAASGGTSSPSCDARVAGDEMAASIARVRAVAAAEFVDQRAGPDPGPAAGERDGLRLTIEETEIRQPGAAVAAGALERERVGIAPLPAEAREDRIATGQLVIHAHVGAIALAVQREDLAKRAVAAGRKVRLVRKRIEEVEDAPRRGIDPVGRDAVARELDAGQRVAHDERIRREIAVAHRRRRHDRLRAAAERLQLAAFVVPEEERPVRHDRAAKASTVPIIVRVGVGVARATRRSAPARRCRAFSSFEL